MERPQQKMHVILTYHNLETRNPRFISSLWENSVYTGLILIIAFGLLSNLTIQRVLDTYDDSNVFTAKIHFKNRSKIKKPTNLNTSTIWRTWKKLTGPGKSDPNHLVTHIYRTLKTPTEFDYLFDDIESDEDICTNGKNHKLCMTDQKFREEVKKDKKFVSDMVIDNNKTTYGSVYLRDYMVFYPLFSSIVAIQWLVLLFNFRVGAYFFQDWKTSKPWIMVVPAIIVHAVMTINTATYKYYSNYYFQRFCNNLKMNLTHPKFFSCGYLMDNLYVASWKEMQLLAPTSLHYFIYGNAVFFMVLLWLSILLIVFFRWLFGIDFQLIHVTISAFIPSKEIMLDKKNK